MLATTELNTIMFFGEFVLRELEVGTTIIVYLFFFSFFCGTRSIVPGVSYKCRILHDVCVYVDSCKGDLHQF